MNWRAGPRARSVKCRRVGRPVVVLDHLDECGYRDMLVWLMESAIIIGKLPRNIMILVGARPEPETRNT